MISVLRHLEDRLDLPAPGPSDVGFPVNADGEATLSVDETNNILSTELESGSLGFLLIVPH